MCKKSGIIEKAISTGIVRELFGGISLKAFAEEAGTEPSDDGESNKSQTPATPTINYEDLIAKARSEEKKKQYKTIEGLKEQVSTLTSQHNDDLLKIAGLEKQVEELNQKLTTAGEGDTKEVETLKAEINNLREDKKKLESTVSELEKNKPVSKEEIEKEVRAELEKEYEVKTYKAEKMAEYKDEILVPELVMGSTKEELDTAIEVALERSKQIRESLGVNNPKKKEKRTPKSPNNPSISGVQDNQYSLDYLAGLDVSSPEYLEVRKKLGLH